MDIQFPTATSSPDQGERALDNALPADQIKAVRYHKTQLKMTDKLQQRHQQRIQHDPGFQFLSTEETAVAEASEKTEVTLLEARRKKEWEEREQVRRQQENQWRQQVGLPPRPLGEDTDNLSHEEREHESKLVKQIELDEAARILADYIDLQRPLAVMR